MRRMLVFAGRGLFAGGPMTEFTLWELHAPTAGAPWTLLLSVLHLLAAESLDLYCW